MTALPTVGRVVLVQTELGHLVPAIVTGSSAGGCVHVVAFSHEWPLTAARAFRELPHVDTLRLGGAPPAWLWPPRVDPPAGPSSSEVSRELAREQAALTRSLAALAARVTALERAASGAVLLTGREPG